MTAEKRQIDEKIDALDAMRQEASKGGGQDRIDQSDKGGTAYCGSLKQPHFITLAQAQAPCTSIGGSATMTPASSCLNRGESSLIRA